jgi:hypothetical protein
MLPRPSVSVTSRRECGHEVDVVIYRQNSARSYRGGGVHHTQDAAVADVIKKILADPYSAEWLPERKT